GSLAEPVPWNARASDPATETSARLLALLSAAPDLEPEERMKLATSLESALVAGAVALPAPADTVSVASRESGPRFAFDEDPWWRALRERVEQLLPPGGQEASMRWARAFRVDERRQLALDRMVRNVFEGAAVTDPDPGPKSVRGWTLVQITDDAWLARRASADEARSLKAALHSRADLQAMTRQLAAVTNDLVPHAFRDGEAPTKTEVIADAGPLAGTDLRLAICHPDPEQLAEAARRRLTHLRLGLFALAALILAITALAARLIQRARSLQNLRTTFVASVSHDLRTPLASIGLMAENLRAGYAKGREPHYGHKIERETHRLRRLIDDLLDFGRIERGLSPNVRRRDVEVAPWMEAFSARERDRCAAKGCALSTTLGPALGSASLDAEALERAVSNLIDNALKHGGAEAIHLIVERSDGNTALHISVEDRGRGLPAGSVSERLFEPFERHSDVSGTGLGLTIVRAIAEAHGGRASLGAGTGGRGTRAVLTLPTPEEEAA
ncbi:MAG: HAMP domain-containing sensor histidine kinase, partial [Planctomycetota bacterium]